MSDALEEKDEYARTLEEAGYLKKEGADDTPAPDTTKTETNTAATDTSTSTDTTKTPAADTTDTSKTSTTTATQTPAATTDDELFPGFKSLPADAQKAARERFDAINARVDELDKRWRAQHGQLAPTQRELEQARRHIQTLSERLKAAQQRVPVPAGAPKLSDEFRNNYPDEAQAFDAITAHFTEQVKALETQNAELRESLSGVTSTVTRDKQMQTLASRHADWQEIDNSPMFKEWLKDIPESKRKLLTSSNGNDVADLIDDYKRDFALAQTIVANETKQHAATTTTTPQATKAPEADPNPTQRQSARLSAPNAGSSEADDYVSTLLSAGYKV